MEESLTQIKELKIKLNELTSTYKDLQTQYKTIGGQMRAIDKEKDNLTKQIKDLQVSIDTANIFSTFADLNSISKEEQCKIVGGMDKTDYTKYGKERWMDLNSIVDQVIEVKKEFSDWKLESLTKSHKYDTLPPKNFYRFTYKTPKGHYFTVGGFHLY